MTEEAMAAVFRDGHDPVTGEPLGRGFQGESPVVGFDLTFTALKSVSVLWGLADEPTRAAVYAAHRAALVQALAFVERTVVRTRAGDGGYRQVATRGMIAAAFDHWDTRASDPTSCQCTRSVGDRVASRASANTNPRRANRPTV